MHLKLLLSILAFLVLSDGGAGEGKQAMPPTASSNLTITAASGNVQIAGKMPMTIAPTRMAGLGM